MGVTSADYSRMKCLVNESLSYMQHLTSCQKGWNRNTNSAMTRAQFNYLTLQKTNWQLHKISIKLFNCIPHSPSVLKFSGKSMLRIFHRRKTRDEVIKHTNKLLHNNKLSVLRCFLRGIPIAPFLDLALSSS